MGLFNKNKNSISPTASITSSANKEAISSIISQDMQIVGEITFKGKAKLDGRLEGNLTGEYLVLSDTGYINGDMRLDTLICYGKVKGDIHAKTVTIHSTATIKGKLTAASLTVEPGALLSGEISAAYKDQKVPSVATNSPGLSATKAMPKLKENVVMKEEGKGDK